jgi:hypothetical protein
MAEQSHRDEMNAAIRAQRERHAAPRTIAPVDEPVAAAPEAHLPLQQPEPEPEPPAPQAAPPPVDEAAPARRSLLDRFRGR